MLNSKSNRSSEFPRDVLNRPGARQRLQHALASISEPPRREFRVERIRKATQTGAMVYEFFADVERREYHPCLVFFRAFGLCPHLEPETCAEYYRVVYAEDPTGVREPEIFLEKLE